MSGNIIVDGVVASTHTKWLGEEAALRFIPARYRPTTTVEITALKHMLHAPVRTAYRVLESLDSWLVSMNLPALEAFKHLDQFLKVFNDALLGKGGVREALKIAARRRAAASVGEGASCAAFKAAAADGTAQGFHGITGHTSFVSVA
jgi:hypothetical protein